MTKENRRLMKTPKNVDIDITNQCNLRCIYCGHFTSPGDVAEDLPLEEWMTFLEELRDCAVMTLTLSGGEAFLREDIKEVIEGVVRNKMRFGVLSNGTLITDDIAEFLKSTGRCTHVQVSIDGSGPETHDVFRGDGSFVRALDGLRALLRHGVSAAVRVTIHRNNVHHLDRVAELLLEDVGLSNFGTNAASHLGLCRKNEDMAQLTAEDQSVAMKTLYELNEKYGNRINALAGPLANAQHWLEMVQARNEGKDGLPGRGYLRSCGGVMAKLNVRADGIMTPCNQMSHIELGRINQDRVRDVWQKHEELVRLRERRNVPLDEFEFCQGCEYIPFCRGGCPALAYTITGTDHGPAPDSCLRRFLEAGGTLPDVASAGAPASC